MLKGDRLFFIESPTPSVYSSVMVGRGGKQSKQQLSVLGLQDFCSELCAQTQCSYQSMGINMCDQLSIVISAYFGYRDSTTMC